MTAADGLRWARRLRLLARAPMLLRAEKDELRELADVLEQEGTELAAAVLHEVNELQEKTVT